MLTHLYRTQDLFSDLVAQKVYTRKHIDQLEAVKLKLAEVKATAPAVKEAVSSVQEQEGKRIKSDIQDFTDDVNKHARDFRKISFLQSATGIEASYTSIDAEVRHPTTADASCSASCRAPQ